MSLICNNTSASNTSVRVDSNEATNSWGKSLINPMVSKIIAFSL